MRIRLLKSISGTNGSFKPGDETDWPDAKDAANLIKAGIAEKVTATRKRAKVETATETKATESATTD
ncbi:MAG: hypothetical protein QF638_08215 [Acidimicrobiales bacterium]|jgi:hypothetical protein|nr:hypothetical protein [Acidimicrobiales bacterium]